MCKTNVYIEVVFSDIKHQQRFQQYKELQFSDNLTNGIKIYN